MNEKIIGLGLEICIAVMHIMYVDYYSSASIWYNKKSHLWASKRDERHTVQSALASRFQLPRDLPNFSTIFHNMEDNHFHIRSSPVKLRGNEARGGDDGANCPPPRRDLLGY